MAHRCETILNFWFGEFPDKYSSDPTRIEMWFQNGSSYDATIKWRFGDDYHKAVKGEYNDWAEFPRGRLALIIMLDQFSRHIHRETPQAFAQDEKSQQLCLNGIELGVDKTYHYAEKTFFLLPLEHAENLDLQNLCVKKFTEILNDVPENEKKLFKGTLDFARRHQYIIERFGHFPELNEILGRETTADEIEFMKNPAFAFL